MADVLYSETEVIQTVVTYEDHTVFVTTDVPSVLYSESEPQVLHETSPQVVFQLVTQSEVVHTLVTKDVGPRIVTHMKPQELLLLVFLRLVIYVSIF